MLLLSQNLSKNFAQKQVLSCIEFSIGQGEIIGLIGPNGSGKTTLLNILLGMMQPTSGSFITHTDLKIGMAIARKGFFDDMTVIRNIQHYATLLGLDQKRIDECLSVFSIDYLDAPYSKLSSGMKQRVSLLLAFARHNDLIFLDEPTNHLDIDSILNLRNLILKEKAARTSFLITSHALSDIEKVCDRILFLKHGVLVQNALTDDLLKTYGDLEQAYINILR
ncbi:ABC transporter ATP-binding protein [Ohtaekwangia kribbensis]|jgi:ABC-2 type transport system ATP-binding protein|uniref:ABC transporter ATP-binding protein n=1 Tax=Ohtaekwangia kribbensis TaxID=688913 RepID=A0ABW3K4T4_9BACT